MRIDRDPNPVHRRHNTVITDMINHDYKTIILRSQNFSSHIFRFWPIITALAVTLKVKNKIKTRKNAPEKKSIQYYKYKTSYTINTIIIKEFAL